MLQIQSERGERGSTHEFKARPNGVLVEIITHKFYGFPGGNGGTVWAVEQAKVHAQGLIDDGGKVTERDAEVEALLGLRLPVAAE